MTQYINQVTDWNFGYYIGAITNGAHQQIFNAPNTGVLDWNDGILNWTFANTYQSNVTEYIYIYTKIGGTNRYLVYNQELLPYETFTPFSWNNPLWIGGNSTSNQIYAYTTSGVVPYYVSYIFIE